MEKYFNYSMFKKKVRVVDLQPSKDGYVFVLEYVGNTPKGHTPKQPAVSQPDAPQYPDNKPVYDVYVGGGAGINGDVFPPTKIAEGVTLPLTIGDPPGDEDSGRVERAALPYDPDDETWWDTMVGKTI